MYAGRFGALKSLIVDTPTTKVLIAKLPKVPGQAISVPATRARALTRAEEIKEPETIQLQHEELEQYAVEWLNFPENTTQIGRKCQGDVCCLYNITVRVPPGNQPNTV